MGKVSTGEFMGKFSGGGGKWSDWRKKGKTIGWIHPDIFIHERSIHGRIPSMETNKDGVDEWRNRRYTCTEEPCVLCELEKFANWAIEQGNDPKEEIIDGNKLTYTLEDLAGKTGWRNNISAKEEYLIPWIPKEGRSDENPVELITATRGLGFAIKRVIESNIEERGTKKGNPEITPYPFKFTYKENETPQNKYSAERIDSDLAPMDEDIQEIMAKTEEDLGFSMATFTDPTPREKVLAALESAWESRDVPFGDFLEYIGEDKREKKESKKEEKKSNKRKAKDNEEGGVRVKCDSCGEIVKPNKFGRCPECATKMEVDVPY